MTEAQKGKKKYQINKIQKNKQTGRQNTSSEMLMVGFKVVSRTEQKRISQNAMWWILGLFFPLFL